MLHALFVIFVLFAILGDARIFLFVLNRVVFGSHRSEKNPWRFLFFVTPPVLLVLTLLFRPLGLWIDRLQSSRFIESITPERFEEMAWSILAAKIGATWLIIAASVGIFWVVDRFRIHVLGVPPVDGVRTLEPEVIRLRKAHVPFAFLRNLGAHNDLYDLEVTRHEVMIPDLPPAFDSYRIAFLTDTHVASFMRRAFYREAVEQVRRFDPDLVLLGGDFVTWRRHVPLMLELLLTGLAARDGVFSVLGNHDIWAGAEHIAAEMSARGVRFAINRSYAIRRGADSLTLVGVDEVYRGEPDVARAFAGVDPSRPCIGISHHPDVIDCSTAAASTSCSAATRTEAKSVSRSSARWWCRRATRPTSRAGSTACATC